MARTLKVALDEANPVTLPDAANAAYLGSLLALIPQSFTGAVVDGVLALPNGVKAAAVLGGYIRAGGTTGPITPSPRYPESLQAAVSGLGDIQFNFDDAVTEATAIFAPLALGEIVEIRATVPESSSVLDIARELVLISSASIDGVDFIIAPRGSAPSSGVVIALSDAGKSVEYSSGAIGFDDVPLIVRGYAPAISRVGVLEDEIGF